MNGEKSVAKKIVASIKSEDSSEFGGNIMRQDGRQEESEPQAPSRRKESSFSPAEKDDEIDVTPSTSSEEDQDPQETKDVALEPSTDSAGPRRRSKRAMKGKKDSG